VDLSYVALGTTRLTVAASRDVQYSFDINQPYYLRRASPPHRQRSSVHSMSLAVLVHAPRYRNRAGAVSCWPTASIMSGRTAPAWGITWAATCASGSTSISRTALSTSQLVGQTIQAACYGFAVDV